VLLLLLQATEPGHINEGSLYNRISVLKFFLY